MAFTSAQRASIRRWLGYPNLFAYKLTRLESAMDTVGNDADASALVVADLASLATLDSKLFGTGTSSAGVKRVDEVEFYEGRVQRELADNGRRIVGRISTTLGVPVYADVFGTRGYPGDALSDLLGTGGNGGNMIPLG